MPQTTFTELLNIEHPIICGAMYPCSNPELVAAASEAGGIGIIQPLSLVYVNGYDFAEGVDYIQSLTKKPLGLNLLVEASSKKYLERSAEWLDIALDKGIRFFVTALGNPNWVAEKVHEKGGYVFHDVTELKWAQKAAKSNVDGFICVNNRAGGHAGTKNSKTLFEEISRLGKHMICAGGISESEDIQDALKLGYQGVQLGTRFIASKECSAHQDYKEAIVKAKEQDIVLTDKISGVPVSVIETPHIKKIGTKASGIAKKLLSHPRTKHYVRLFYTLKSIWQLKKSNQKGSSYKDYWQAGKSVKGIHKVKTVQEIFNDLTKA